MSFIRRNGFYLASLFGWIALSMLSFYVVYRSAVGTVEREFKDHVEMLRTEFRQKALGTESVIASFSAFLAAVEGGDRVGATRFSRAILTNYPHIYMLEVARMVKGTERIAFEKMMRQSWQTDFQLRTFHYGGHRNWEELQGKQEYWPLVFLQPEFPEVRQIYGLDLDSVSHLASSLHEARRSDSPVVTLPFKLVEGDLAYVLYQSVGRLDRVRSGAFSGELMSLAVIKADSMAPKWLHERTSMSLRLLPTRRDLPPLYERSRDLASALERALLPRLTLTVEAGTAAQPAQMAFDRQLLWDDVDTVSTRAVGVLSILTLALFMLYLRHHQLATLSAEIERQRAQYMALHDPLTQLANRTLFDDRVRQAISRWQRSEDRFGLLMIDLDHFKDINDKYGHDGGDAVLTTLARRIESALRATDTVARYGGDEFLVLIDRLQDEREIVGVAEKVLEAVAEPIELSGQSVMVTCSVGVAICPRDGVDLEDLSRQADHAMYRVKNSGRNGVSVAAEGAHLGVAR